MKTLSVTISDQLYERLRHTVPSRKISKFVSNALERCLSEHQQAIYQAYAEAAKDIAREHELNDWDNLNIEHWENTSPSKN